MLGVDKLHAMLKSIERLTNLGAVNSSSEQVYEAMLKVRYEGKNNSTKQRSIYGKPKNA
jgi:hypothetical protein